jgi:hypothetical protein
LGHIETPTLEEFIRIIVKFTLTKAKIFAIDPRFKAVKDESNNCYPSTEFGHIAVEKMFKTYSF